MNNQQAVLQAQGLSKTYHDGKLNVQVLEGVDLTIQPGEKIAIVGTSGSGKSTLLHLLGGLDTPTSGEVQIQGEHMSRFSDKARGILRNRAVGMVYQFHHLLPEFTALENVALPRLIQGADVDEAKQRAEDLLGKVGLAQRVLHKPGELSGGERQRTAIARALVNHPAIVLADEPTGNLDTHTANHVWQQMLQLNTDMGTTLVVVTHDQHLAEQMDTIYLLEDGVLTVQGVSKNRSVI
ncbi:MAG TPA: lipoprotein-releasing ABC transporter ATP-binding protein LolD [Chromatiales bacterium]|nr:lipoprotein-releasing ABC transporter ATP-binding protein LolD [Chromatiales bacterium]